MEPFLVVIPNETVYLRIRFFIGLKTMALKALPFDDAVVRFNMCIFVWRMRGNAFMLDPGLLAKRVKCLADELGTIVRPNDQRLRLAVNVVLEQSLLERS
ncbi:hypothetical protein D3C71_1561280 [compost metagenome]